MKGTVVRLIVVAVFVSLQFFAWLETNCLAGWYCYFFARPRVAPDAPFPGFNYENSKTT